ncbi:MAG: cystathionine gamma-synthase [Lysobacterales bacterium]|jgi:cystathionine gamma-synthase
MSNSKITSTVRAGVNRDTAHGSVIPPLYLSANYSFDGLGGKREYDYARTGNPTRDQLGDALSDLEGGQGAVVTNSGMAAVVLVTHLLKADDTVIVPHNCYGGCYRAFDSLSRAGHFRVRFVDFNDSGALQRACAEHRPAMIWVETPSNPLLRITDIAAVAARAKAIGALLVVDNTFLTPLLQQPLALGADIVVHSTTKYINGHSDVIGGAVIARDAAVAEELAWWANCIGSTGSAFDSYQTLRGLRTLAARLACHQANTLEVLATLERHPAVRRVHFPGLEAHPEHELAKRQQSGFGAIVSFELDGGREQLAAFVDGLEHFTLAESLGGVESLICHPASMTHAAMTPEAQSRAGIGETLLRLSVGIESASDLAADVRAGLDRASRVAGAAIGFANFA